MTVKGLNRLGLVANALAVVLNLWAVSVSGSPVRVSVWVGILREK